MNQKHSEEKRGDPLLLDKDGYECLNYNVLSFLSRMKIYGEVMIKDGVRTLCEEEGMSEKGLAGNV